jgi:hypothetical protein
MNRKIERSSRRSIFRELIIGFGFVNGFWFGIGIDPQKIILTFLGNYINIMPAIIQKAFTIIPIILTAISVITIFRIYRRGGILGGVAVLVAFLAGALLLKDWHSSIILGLAAILLGLITFKK